MAKYSQRKIKPGVDYQIKGVAVEDLWVTQGNVKDITSAREKGLI